MSSFITPSSSLPSSSSSSPSQQPQFTANNDKHSKTTEECKNFEKVPPVVRSEEKSLCNGKFDNYAVEGLPPPAYKWCTNIGEYELEGEHLDVSKHLQLEPPTHVKDLRFRDVPYPYSSSSSSSSEPHKSIEVGQLAYTRPFRVLSDEGVRIAKAEVERNMERPGLARHDDRAPFYMRGLAYVSNFHRELAYSPEVLELLSDIARDPIAVHSTPMNISHMNIGKVKTGKPVDKWHVDSTDYVLVIVLSDQTNMIGGDLRVLQMPNASNQGSNITVFDKLQAEGVPEELVETVKYAKAGYGIFMQGCKILHTVSEVLQAREPRMSLVNSYLSRRVFLQPDKTRFNSYVRFDGWNVAAADYARHKAWRVGGQLQYIKDHVTYNAAEGASCEELSVILRAAAAELAHAADLLDKKTEDGAKWVESKTVAATKTKSTAPVNST